MILCRTDAIEKELDLLSDVSVTTPVATILDDNEENAYLNDSNGKPVKILKLIKISNYNYIICKTVSLFITICKCTASSSLKGY